MNQMTLQELAKKMAGIDFAMLSTHTQDGSVAARPMSNNGDVEYDGDSFYFTYENARTVGDIERDANVGLSFQGAKGLFGKPPLFVSVEGKAELIRDKAQFEAHWTKELDYWFKQGIDTPGIVLIKVHAVRVHYWDGEDEGEVPMA
jgi:general stress protein 26